MASTPSVTTSSLAAASRLAGKKAALASGVHATMTKAEAAIARKKLELQQAIDKSALEAQLASGTASAATATDERLPARGAVVEPPLTRKEALRLLEFVEELHQGQNVVNLKLESILQILENDKDDMEEEESSSSSDEERDEELVRTPLAARPTPILDLTADSEDLPEPPRKKVRPWCECSTCCTVRKRSRYYAGEGTTGDFDGFGS